MVAPGRSRSMTTRAGPSVRPLRGPAGPVAWEPVVGGLSAVVRPVASVRAGSVTGSLLADGGCWSGRRVPAGPLGGAAGAAAARPGAAGGVAAGGGGAERGGQASGERAGGIGHGFSPGRRWLLVGSAGTGPAAGRGRSDRRGSVGSTRPTGSMGPTR